jgi:hypothetical protein
MLVLCQLPGMTDYIISFRNVGKQMSNQTKLRIQNITAKTALKYGSKTWVLNKEINDVWKQRR